MDKNSEYACTDNKPVKENVSNIEENEESD